MEKGIILGVIGVLLIAMITPTFAYYATAWDYDLNDDNTIEASEVTYAVDCYYNGSYDSRIDFNANGTIDKEDVLWMSLAYQYQPTLPDLGYDIAMWNYNRLVWFNETNYAHLTLDWYLWWNGLNWHPYQHPDYVCRHFAWDYEDAFYDDYGEYGVRWSNYDAEYYGHAYTTVFIGGDPLNDTSWQVFTSNNVCIAWGVTLDAFNDTIRRRVFLENGYIVWNGDEHTGTYMEN